LIYALEVFDLLVGWLRPLRPRSFGLPWREALLAIANLHLRAAGFILYQNQIGAGPDAGKLGRAGDILIFQGKYGPPR
jgi:hypothetical protein